MAKKLSKTTQKLNIKLLDVLAEIRQHAQSSLSGFVNLDHLVQFESFPGSLLVSCYFKHESNLIIAKNEEKRFQRKLHGLLLKKGIVLKKPQQNLRFCLFNQKSD